MLGSVDEQVSLNLIVEQIRRVFDDLRDNFACFCIKHTLWILIRITSTRRFQ